MTDSRPLAAAIGGVSLIGAPTDIGAGTLGARMGPAALRVAGIAQAVAQFGIDVRDCGNLDGPANPWQDAVDGFRHLPEVVAWNRLLHDAVFAELSDARLPIVHATAASAARSCGCCGSTPTPTSIPPH